MIIAVEYASKPSASLKGNKRGFGRDQLKALTFEHKSIFRVVGTGDCSN